MQVADRVLQRDTRQPSRESRTVWVAAITFGLAGLAVGLWARPTVPLGPRPIGSTLLTDAAADVTTRVSSPESTPVPAPPTWDRGLDIRSVTLTSDGESLAAKFRMAGPLRVSVPQLQSFQVGLTFLRLGEEIYTLRGSIRDGRTTISGSDVIEGRHGGQSVHDLACREQAEPCSFSSGGSATGVSGAKWHFETIPTGHLKDLDGSLSVDGRTIALRVSLQPLRHLYYSASWKASVSASILHPGSVESGEVWQGWSDLVPNDGEAFLPVETPKADRRSVEPR